MKKLFLFLIFCTYLSPLFSQQNQTTSFVKDSIEQYINWSITNWRVPGMAICIVKDGKIVLMKGYGVKEHDLQDKVNQRTLFMIGSNTKAFTATALAMLQNEKKLNLDDKVTKWLPDFKLDNKLAIQEATIRDLLCHRLGFGTFQGDFTYWTSDLSRHQVMETMAKIKPKFSFKSEWGYTNVAFVTAGELIPRVTKKPWEEFLKEKLFNPLGMNNTIALSKDLIAEKNKSAAHTIFEGRMITIPYPQLDNLAPAASISSSIEDMSKWVSMLLTGGKSGNHQVVPENVIKETWRPQSVVGDANHQSNSSDTSLYGLGWLIESYAGKNIISHTGGVNGFLSSVTLVPQENLGIVILTNTDQNNLHKALKWQVVDSYLHLPYRNYSKIFLTGFQKKALEKQQRDKQLRATAAQQIQPLHNLNEYTGKYSNPVYGTITVSQGEESGLEIRFEHHPKLTAWLQPLGGDRFYGLFSDPVFGRDVFPFGILNGKINSVKIKVSDFIEIEPYEFKKM